MTVKNANSSAGADDAVRPALESSWVVSGQDDVRQGPNPRHSLPARALVRTTGRPILLYVLVLIYDVACDNDWPHISAHEHALAARRVTAEGQDPHGPAR
jgi:hypothetical protein